MIDYLLNLVKEKLCDTLSDAKSKNDQYRFISLKIPLEQAVPLSASIIDQSFFLCKPDSSQILLGLGSLITIKTRDKERFHNIKSRYKDILKDWKDQEYCTPIAFHAFAFDEHDAMTDEWSGLANTLLTIPIILFKAIKSRQTLFINIDLIKSRDRDNYINDLLLKIESLLKAYFNDIKQSIAYKIESETQLFNNPLSISWLQLTKKAIHKIHSGSIEKIVTSRQFTLKKEQKISIPKLSQNLIKNYPGCTILSYQFSGKTIIAASPEKLLSLEYPNIQSDAIGGTIHKNTDNAMYSLAQSPLANKNKLLKEHDFIVQAIYQELDSLCHTLKMPVSPFLMKLHNMYHLETPIQGKLMEQYDLFDVIEKLHPTPAVAGYPTKKAQQWLLDNEDYQRGWYTGAFGYLENNAQGQINGELSVMLRCAIINKNKMTLFAGAGLVAESEPEMEWQETELKMQTILEMI